jgi:phosphate transport system substrate-binding protein
VTAAFAPRGRTVKVGIAVALGTALAWFPAPCFAQGTAAATLTGRLLITGSSTMAPMIEDMGKRFRVRHPGVVITVEAGGSGRGIADALEGKADIGMASRELAAQEKALFAIPIARDGVVFAVHKDNPIRGVTRAQLLAVFTGKTARWKAIGGRDAPIEVVTRTPGHASLEIVSHYFGIAPDAIKAAGMIGDNAEVLRLVAANRDAIAFLSVGAVDASVQKGLPLKPLALDGIAPGIGSVRDGSWPLSRPLSLLTRRVPTGLAKAFIEFALSPAAREVILQHDFVPYLS